jgi:hypothetical protein
VAPSRCSTSYGGWQQLQREQDIWQKPSGASSALKQGGEQAQGEEGREAKAWHGAG